MPKRQISQSLQKEIATLDNLQPKADKNNSKKTYKLGDIVGYDKSKQRPLNRAYFRQEVVKLAEDLLGKVILHETQQGTLRAVIVQTQAYKAPLDKGCHAYNNKKTQRTKYFWLDGGHLYVYNIYMPTNICLNVVAGLQNQPQAVLIRAVQPVQGIELMRVKRNINSKKIEDLSNGPGKVGQCLLVNKQKMNGCDLVQGKLRIVDGGINIKDLKIGVSKRINIDYAEEWRDKLWRFFIANNSYVSKVNPDAAVKEKKK